LAHNHSGSHTYGIHMGFLGEGTKYYAGSLMPVSI